MSIKKISPLPFVLAIFCLFLPFISISCGGSELLTKSGFDLATGVAIDEFTEARDPDLFIIAFAVVSLLGIIVGFLGSKSASIISTVLGAGGIAGLVISMVMLNNELKQHYEYQAGLITVKYEYGLYLAGFFLLVAIALNLAAYTGKDIIQTEGLQLPGKRPPGMAPPVRKGPMRPGVPPVKQQMERPVEQPVNQPSPAGSNVKPGILPGKNIPHYPPATDPRQPVKQVQPQPVQEKRPDPVPVHQKPAVKEPEKKEMLSPAAVPILAGISGQYAGQKIDLREGKVIIGRDPRFSHLIYDQSNEEISRKHCAVWYDDSKQSFMLEDTSTNGTYLSSKERIAYGQPVYLKAGERFFLSNSEEVFELKME